MSRCDMLKQRAADTVARFDALFADMADAVAALRAHVQAEAVRLHEDTADRPDGPQGPPPLATSAKKDCTH